MNVPIKYFFNKRFLWVFGVAAVVLTICTLFLVGVEYINADKPVYTPNSYGGQHIRVKSQKGSVKYPKELPQDFVPLYEGAKIKDIWIDTDDADEFVQVGIFYTVDESIDEVMEFYKEQLGKEAYISENYITIILNGMDTTIYIKNDADATSVEFVMDME